MYRLVLFYLLFIALIAIILSFVGILPYSGISIIFSIVIISIASGFSNIVVSKLFNIPINIESAFITSIILALIIEPTLSGKYIETLPILAMAGISATLSKYILAINKRHLFNPVALAVVFITYAFGYGASWWVGNVYLLLPVLIGGLLVIRKLRQADLILSFLAANILGLLFYVASHLSELKDVLNLYLYSYILFFVFVMLTEPVTMPDTRKKRIVYGALLGFLFIPQLRIGSFMLGPELALLFGNLFSYFISPQKRYMLRLLNKEKISTGIYNFVFDSKKKIAFIPGQYFEWTESPSRTDNRGNRRYFTIASSPTEENIMLGVRFYDKPSSFKKILLNMQNGDKIAASKLAGEFVMPENRDIKLAFIAGGIGITPFRSMIKFLLDTNEKRDITLMYSNAAEVEIAYKEIFEKAKIDLGINTLYTLTDINSIGKDWWGSRGYVDKEMIIKEIPDYMERVFYLSGSHTMVTSFKSILISLGLSKKQIKTDFFPGLV